MKRTEHFILGSINRKKDLDIDYSDDLSCIGGAAIHYKNKDNYELVCEIYYADFDSDNMIISFEDDESKFTEGQYKDEFNKLFNEAKEHVKLIHEINQQLRWLSKD